MKPADLARSGTESGHQRAVFCWAAYAMQHGFDEARQWMLGVPEGKKAWQVQGGYLNPDLNNPVVPELKWLHHIPNGGARGEDARTRAIRGNALKAEGVKAGVLDLCLPVKRGKYSGLYIEMKKPGKLSTVSAEQREFKAFVESQGFATGVCDDYKQAIALIEEYLSFDGWR